MSKLGRKIIHLIFAALCLATASSRAFGWTDNVHGRAALAAADYFPPAVRDMIYANKAAYLDGIKTEPELYDKVLDEKKDFSVDTLRVRGFERYVYHLQRMKFFFDNKSNTAATVNELGALARLTTDLIEPYPAGDTFRPLEIAGHRIFFISDFDSNFKRFHFMYDGSQLIKDLPKRLDYDLSLSDAKGQIIYDAYRKGLGFSAIESDADATLNRAMNLLVDQVYTMYEGRAGGVAAPFNPSQYLGLDRFRKKSSIKEMTIPGPKPPAPPTSPPSPEKTKKNEEENNSSNETEK